MNEKNEEIEKIKIRIEDLEEGREKDIKKNEKNRIERHYKIITYSLASMIGGVVYFPVTAITKTFGVTVESSIISILICALYGLIIAACARDSPK